MKRLLSVFAMLTVTVGADYVWLEGEAPSRTPQLKQVEGAEKVRDGKGFGYDAWGRTWILSGESMLHVNLSSGDVDTFMPDDGMVFAYDFTLAAGGAQNIWVRIGYEWVRNTFQWRIGGGEWQTSLNSTPTVNIQPIQTWNEIGWLRLGRMQLGAGNHTIEFRHSAYKETDGRGRERTARILHMLDCICITPDEFRPNGKWKPDAEHRTEQDKEAADHVFAVSAGDGSPGRVETRLDGWWTTAAWDESPVNEATRLGPVTELPDLGALAWYAYRAPGDRDAQRPEMGFSHRYLVRAKLDVPDSLTGRGFFLDVQRSNLIASVFVNGVFCGWTKTFHTAWQLDLTKGIKPGQINDLVIVFKDAYYSLNPAGDERAADIGNRRYWNVPRDFLIDNQGIAGRHDMPCAADPSTGITEPATLVVCGPVYAADVFAIPSVKQSQLGLEVSLHNPGGEPAESRVTNEVVPWNGGRGGTSVLTFDPETIQLAAGETRIAKLAKAWADPHLWWPDDPFLYQVVTTVEVGGKVVDVERTRFGFREWDWSTHMFKLNGVRWTMWADLNYGGSPQDLIEMRDRYSHINHMRYWRKGGWAGMTRRQVLDYFDETGMLVRSSGTFDGQRANYGGGLSEADPDGEPDARGRRPRRAKQSLFSNWYDQLEAWVKEERNHPCVYIWSLENEVTYINSWNLGQWAHVEPAMRVAGERVMAVDPTRPIMVDGGNCLHDESLPVNGAHYTELMNVAFRDFPDAAYTREHFYDKDRPQRGAWRMVPDRPIMKGEIYFANGYTTDRFATIGGDRCFIGTGETMEARGLWGKMLSEGYRWAEVASWQFWMGSSERQYWTSWSPVAVLCRQWNSTFGVGATVERTLKVLNSTRRADPIAVGWAFEVGGQRVAGDTRTFTVSPGEAEQFEISFVVPDVGNRTAGELILTAERGGKEVFRDAKPIAVIAPATIAKPKLGAADLAVFDPHGSVKAHLAKRGIAFTEMASATDVPDAARVVVLGRDAISAAQTADTTWYALAATGKRVIVLEQTNPLRYQAIPADLKPTDYTGRFGFSEDLSHPIFSGLAQSDFFTWGSDHVMYRSAYKKGTKGGRSLVQCDDGLTCTALFESQVGDGLLLLSQLAVGDKLGHLGIAQAVFNNMLNYAAAYEPVRKHTLVAVAKDSPRARLLAGLNLQFDRVDSPLDTLKGDCIAVVDASPANLATLAAARDKIQAFCGRGGWLMLWGLTPDGLTDYNTIVQHNHVIRPFRMERVLLSVPQDPLTSGLTLRDVVMDTGQKMYGWMALKKPDKDAFTCIVDHTDIAPFATFPTPVELGKSSNDNPGVDHWPHNMVNGFTSDDNWAFTYTIIMDQGHKRKFTIELPKEEELVTLKIRPSKIYHPITKINLYFDDDPTPVSAELRVEAVTQEIPVPGKKARRITIEVAEWAERGEKNIVVIDNFWLIVKRSDDYVKRVKSLLNVGGLMRYNVGQGGIVLNQLNVVEQETNPINAVKKSDITKALLANMGAVFAGGKLVVAGAGVRYEPVRIPDARFNAYVHHRGEPGWFRGPGDVSGIPVGEQTYANVDYFLSDFSTSPVPSVFMLKSRSNKVKETEITGIKIGKKADALFFLHTCNKENAVDQWERQVADAIRRRREPPEPPAVFNYVVRYVDSKSAIIPVQYSVHIGHWTDANPAPMPGASVAWAGPLVDAKQGEKAVVYSMQWTNPRPDAEIATIDIVNTDNGKYGAPAVFAITAATVE